MIVMKLHLQKPTKTALLVTSYN